MILCHWRYCRAYIMQITMKNGIKIGLVALASIALGAVGAYYFIGGVFGDAKAHGSAHELRLAKTTRSGKVKKITQISVKRQAGEKSVRIVESETSRPDILKDAQINDIDQLSELQKSVLKDIQAALDADDIRALRKALSRFTASIQKGGLGGYSNVPRVIRSAAVQALGWFGSKAAVDLIDFMADSDEDISSEAFDQFELVLQDVSLSDYERAAIVKATAKALTDSERIDTLLFSLIDMRNSVKADTAAAILSEGTEQSKAVLREQMDFYFEDGVSTVDGINKWLAENPDDPDDDEFYGGDKDSE